jgi:hypothetical protein
MVNTTKIIERIQSSDFKELLLKRKNNISISPHALDHLSMAQRKVFSEEELTKPLLHETPELIGLQRNGRYALYYKRKKHYLKLIVNVTVVKMDIITFINTEIIPNIGDVESGN